MTDQRVEGAVRKGVGHLQDAIGGLTGDTETQARGKINQAAGAVQDTYGQVIDTVVGNAQDAFDEIHGFVKARPLAAVGVGVALGVLVGLVFARRD